MALRKYDPKMVIFYEPNLDFLRVVEIYNAERVTFSNNKEALEELEVHLMRYEDSAEKYQHMNNIETEKRAF